MTLAIELWHVTVATTLLCWWAAWRIPVYGQWDFVSPRLAIGLSLLPVVAWGAFWIGVWAS